MDSSTFWYNAAAWVQAIGTIAAVIGSAWLAAGKSRAARRRDREAKIASKTAALNLAILAHTHVRNLLQLLRDEARRGRLNHISPSRSFATNQQLLLGFPIQSLDDPDAMVAFAFFPGALAMAADIYGHLEEAVRAAEDDDPVDVFEHYAGQMGAIEEMLTERLAELKAVLNLPDAIGAGHDVAPFRIRRHLSKQLRRSQSVGT